MRKIGLLAASLLLFPSAGLLARASSDLAAKTPGQDQPQRPIFHALGVVCEADSIIPASKNRPVLPLKTELSSGQTAAPAGLARSRGEGKSYRAELTVKHGELDIRIFRRAGLGQKNLAQIKKIKEGEKYIIEVQVK